MERAQIPPSCNTYYSSCSYAGPNVLRRAIRQLNLQSVSSKAAETETRLRFGGPPDIIVQSSSRAGGRKQSDPTDVRGLPQFPEVPAHVSSQPLRISRHMPAAPHIKLALPPAATAHLSKGRRMLTCARDAGASRTTGHVHQSVSHIGTVQKVRSTSDVLVLARKRLSARVRPDNAAGKVPTSFGGGDLKEESNDIPSRSTVLCHGWTEGGAMLSRGEESFVEEGASGDERRESSVASCSGDDDFSEVESDVYCCAEEELTDLEGEEGDSRVFRDNASSTPVKGPVLSVAEGDGLTWMNRTEEERLVPADETEREAIAVRCPVMMTSCASSSRGVVTVCEHPPLSLLTPSLFPGVLPVIHFPRPDEKYVPFPPDKRALLKWKMSTITPNVVKSLIAKVGFTICSKGSSWLGYWGKHMKDEAFRSLKEYQKVNHFPGTFQIGRKDRLWKNLSRMQLKVGKKECDFVPLTFILPQDLKKLRREWEKGGTKQRWILKPPAAARGIGIRLACKWSQIPKKKPVVVQRYISNPFLINGSKFDMRIYAYVSSYDPLRIYVFKDGLARFATCKYSTAAKSTSNRFIHLTNYSVNKQNASFIANSDETLCQGHKWGLVALWQYMKDELGIETDPIWESVKDIVVKTIICSEPVVTSLMRAHVRNSASCHELFGFDIILDRNLKAWILEVNISPSLHSTSQLDLNIKGLMMADLFNIAGFRFPTPESLQEGKSHPSGLSVVERAKHLQFTKKNLSELERMSILDTLTPDDLKVLMSTEDEFARCGSFERVYPSIDAHKYHHFFENERYYNILLEQWILKYHKSPKQGIALLQRLAQL